MANGGAFNIRNRGGGSYNPDCDYCCNCGQQGHGEEGGGCDPEVLRALEIREKEREEQKLLDDLEKSLQTPRWLKYAAGICPLLVGSIGLVLTYSTSVTAWGARAIFMLLIVFGIVGINHVRKNK